MVVMMGKVSQDTCKGEVNPKYTRGSLRLMSLLMV